MTSPPPTRRRPGLQDWPRPASTVARWIVRLQDLALGVVSTALAMVSLLSTDPAGIDARLHRPDLLAVLATAAAGFSLTWRRRRPLGSYLVFVACSLVVSLSGHYIGLLSVLMLLSLYSLAVHGRRRDGLFGLGVGLAAFVALALLDVPDLGTTVLLQSLALLVAAWAVGDAVRWRRRYQRDQIAAAVVQERLRIARELHDVVSHSLSLIAVQAGAGAHVFRTDPDAGGRALDVIEETSRRALEQTRSVLRMLRDDEDPTGTTDPVAGLDDLAALISDFEAAGVTVDLDLGALPGLDPAVSLTAYRVVQESLTNVLKHSRARAATVKLGQMGSRLIIDVADPGPAAPQPGSGARHGLVGLEERVRLLGGTMSCAGRHPGDGPGFTVHVELPSGGAG